VATGHIDQLGERGIGLTATKPDQDAFCCIEDAPT
jgi:hypothetical protein